MAGVGVVHNDGLFRPAVDVHVCRAHAEHVCAFIYNVALAENVALLLQICDVDGYRAPGEIQLRGQLVLRDGGVLLNDMEYFSFAFGHGSTSGQKFIF